LDESVEQQRKVQELPDMKSFQVDPLDFDRRLNIEKEIERLPEQLQ
jgi:hypothetical protein